MKKSISRKFLIGLVIFSIVLAVVLCVLISYFFTIRTIQKYEYIGTSLTQSIASRIDGDRINDYIANGPDEEYNEVLDEINKMHDSFQCLYIYVIVPQSEDVLYIWSNGFSGEETIGFTTPYSPGGEDWIRKKFSGKTVDTLCFVEDPDFGDIATAATPVYTADGYISALACADFSVSEIRQTIIGVIINTVLMLLILMGLYTLIYYRYVDASLVSPIRKLTDAAKNMTDNLEKDEHFEMDIHTGDELEALAESFQKMDVELREYISDNLRITAEKERIGTELNTARRIQESMLPSIFPPFPERKEFDLYAVMDPAKEIGGDFYDFFLIDDDHLCLVIADVSGKSIPAALFMMISKIIISTNAFGGKTPATILRESNNIICRNNSEMMFVTVWLGILEISTGKLTAANAGHETPAIRYPDGNFEMLGDKHGFVLGGMEDMEYGEYELQMKPGTKLFVYTDGVPEATNSSDELYGIERMVAALNKDPGASPEQILKNVREDVDAFVKEADQFDDLTMLCFDYYGA